jgi:hypothetical protein
VQQFPVLKFISPFMRVLGWILVAIGVVLGLGGLLFNSPVNDLGRLPSFLSGLAMTIQGLLLVGASEVIGVLFAIEANGRSVEQRLARLEWEQRA